MKTRTRIATAVSVVIATLLVGSPAFAYDPANPTNFDRSDDSFHIVTIIVLMVILLAIVIALSTWIGHQFTKGLRRKQNNAS